jgi:hypothetical protein
LLAQLHAPDLTYHFHGDHLLALLLNISAGQLNTLVNFESALLGLDGQFSVGGNKHADQVILLCDSSKFGKRSLVRACALDEIDVLITDSPPPRALAAALAVASVKVIVAT